MPKKSKFCHKLQQWGTPVLAFATLMLFISTATYAAITWYTGKDIKTAIEYYSSERILSVLWGEYNYDRNLVVLDVTFSKITSDGRSVLQKDLDITSHELWMAEAKLHNLRYLPSASSDNVARALNQFSSDYTKIIDKSSQNRDAE